MTATTEDLEPRTAAHIERVKMFMALMDADSESFGLVEWEDVYPLLNEMLGAFEDSEKKRWKLIQAATLVVEGTAVEAGTTPLRMKMLRDALEG